MKKSFLLSLFALLFVKAIAVNPPDEGMWLPMFVEGYNYQEMKKLGLKLSAEEMYSINKSSLKDAIVQMGNFCTGEIISQNGLMITNHHCGYESIANHSTETNDYLKYGFWAESYEQELPNEGLTATFLVRMDNVTKSVLKEVTKNNDPADRDAKVRKAIKELVKTNSENGKYTVDIKPFFEGNEYYMFVYQIFKDVRLVGTPPSSIGKFGGDTDNWMWPRHTGDFSIFRIYTAPDGSPAEYSKENIPLKPKHVLPINIKGVEKGDYTMVWGFPGTTDRFMTSYEINNMLNTDNKGLIEILDFVLPSIHEEMEARDIVRIKYAADYASMANTWKNKKGETESLIRLKVADQKAAQEKELLNWINSDNARAEKYGNPFVEIEKICNAVDANASKAFWFANFALMLSKTSFVLYNIPPIKLKENQKEFTDAEKESILSAYREFMKNTDAKTEIKIIESELNLWKTIPAEYQPAIFASINKKYKGNIHSFATACVEKSIIGNESNLKKYLDKPSTKIYDNDPCIMYFNTVLSTLFAQRGKTIDSQSLTLHRRTYLAALKEMEKDKAMYPDANSTMRFTYGKVVDCYPVDGVKYQHYTTAEGILEKEIPGDYEFDVDPKLKKLIENKDFGRYADKDGSLHVCFLSDNDITGGNSGSPVLNGKGELIGLAFDGNIEALSSNIAFDKKLQRCINVDSRYVLFVIDKFAGAKRLIDEMNIIQ